MLEEMKLKDLMELVNLLRNKEDIIIQDGRYVIVRAHSAGVFAGNFHSRANDSVILKNARRLWRWSGAASLSQLCMEGVSDPENCMFPCEVNNVELFGVIEILECTEEAKKSIKSVKIWEK